MHEKESGTEMFGIEDIINLAVQIEENAEKVLRGAATQVGNPALVSLLHWLADEEVKHAEWFCKLKEKAKTTIEDPELEGAGKAILQGILGDQTFSLQDVDFPKVHQIDDLLKRVVEFEEDTILFYEMIRSYVEAEDLNDFDKIIEEERSHIRILEDFLNSDVEKGYGGGDVGS